ncbi:MAG: leucine-rich repeat domain-containing protein [Cyclobacteriaceae bacterium]|nr:leucine-rich repeat domain-containing protein [Cyclobacteriaceae bacterium]
MSNFWFSLLLFTVMLTASLPANGQRVFSAVEEPVFSSGQDSLRFAQVNLAIRKAMEQRTTFPDSLMEEFRALRNRIVGYKRHYTPTAGFITLDSLKKMPDKSQVKSLSISTQKSRKLPAEVYACTNLQELELVHTRIKKVQRLDRLKSLGALYILNNKANGKFSLSKTKTVRTLVMRGDTPTLPRSFSPLVALERADLAANQLTTFPTGLSNNKNLKQLILSNNAIVELNIPVLPALEKLELVRNRIEIIPESIGNLGNLKQLTLNHNNIKLVSPALGKLVRLEQLSFYQNKLTTMPDGIYNLPALREVDLYHNEIERLDDRIGNLKRLELLYLSYNKLISIPEAVGNLTALTQLYLSDNRLVELPPALSALAKLKVMRVNNNRLFNSPTWLSGLTELENVDLSSNQLHELPEGLEYLSALKILALINNPWDEPSRDRLTKLAHYLRSKGVVVHIEEE